MVVSEGVPLKVGDGFSLGVGEGRSLRVKVALVWVCEGVALRLGIIE